MKRFVLDTSGLLRLYIPDGPVPDGLETAVEAGWLGNAVLLVPELLLAEVAQVLWKKERAGTLEPNEARDIFAAVLELPLLVIGHRDLMTDAAALARAHTLTVYDALFLALARQQRADLVTADERLAKAAAS